MDFMYYMLHIKRGHSKKDWDLDKILKAAHGVSKDSPARRAVYLADNDIIDQLNDQARKSLFRLEVCGHRWFKNGGAIIRFMEISEKVATYLTQL